MIAQKAIGQRFVFTQQAQQQVLRFYIRRTELAGLISCKEDYAPCFLCIPLEHMPLTQMPPVTSAEDISLPPRCKPAPRREEAFLSGKRLRHRRCKHATPDKPAVCQKTQTNSKT